MNNNKSPSALMRSMHAPPASGDSSDGNAGYTTDSAERKTWFTPEQIAEARAAHDAAMHSGGKNAQFTRSVAPRHPAESAKAIIGAHIRSKASGTVTGSSAESAKAMIEARIRSQASTPVTGSSGVKENVAPKSVSSISNATTPIKQALINESIENYKLKVDFLKGKVDALDSKLEELVAKFDALAIAQPSTDQQDNAVVKKLASDMEKVEAVLSDHYNTIKVVHAAHLKDHDAQLEEHEAHIVHLAEKINEEPAAPTDNGDQLERAFARLTALEEAEELRRGLGGAAALSPFKINVKYPDGEVMEIQTFAKMPIAKLIERIKRKHKVDQTGNRAIVEYLGEQLGHLRSVGEWDIEAGVLLYFKYE